MRLLTFVAPLSATASLATALAPQELTVRQSSPIVTRANTNTTPPALAPLLPSGAKASPVDVLPWLWPWSWGDVGIHPILMVLLVALVLSLIYLVLHRCHSHSTSSEKADISLFRSLLAFIGIKSAGAAGRSRIDDARSAPNESGGVSERDGTRRRVKSSHAQLNCRSSPTNRRAGEKSVIDIESEPLLDSENSSAQHSDDDDGNEDHLSNANDRLLTPASRLFVRKNTIKFIPSLVLPQVVPSDYQPLLMQQIVLQLIPHLSELLTLRDWELTYSSSLHGYSLNELYRRLSLSEDHRDEPCLLLIRDSDGYVFGSFSSSSWHIEPLYYSNATCFVFSAEPVFRVYPAVELSKLLRYGGNDNESRSKDANDGAGYFMLARDDFLSIGGGGSFAFYLDAQLRHGSSDFCSTFNSPRLSKQKNFLAYDVECWSFG